MKGNIPITRKRDEVTIERGIRVTTPTRTILDYAAIATDRELEYALDQAEKQLEAH